MKRVKWLAVAVSAMVVSGSMFSQETTTENTASPPAVAPRADSEALDYLYNRSPAEGTAAGNATEDYRRGKSGAEGKQNALESIVSSQSLLPSDFEKFLSAPEADKKLVQEYRDLYNATLGFLNQRKPLEAWQRLFAMSEFEWDAGLSKQIANRVRAIWDTNATTSGILAENDKLQNQIRSANWNADMHAESTRRDNEDRAKANPDDKSSAATAVADTAKSAPGALRMTEEYFKSLDSKARIKLNEAKISNIKTKARADLVDYISTLYKSKRYGHAVLAAEFYQALFVDGELPPEVANQATASLEATRDISQAVEVFRFKVDQRQIATASTILQKAWETGETTPEMLALERSAKLSIIDHANRVRRMKNLIEARNFDQLEATLNEMDEKAADFDTTKPRSLIQAIKLDSRMRLGKAKLYVQQGNPNKAMEEFKAAAEMWPGNPELDKASSEYFSVEDASAKNITEFDREFAAGNHRAIAEKQVQYLAFVQSDEARKAKFTESLQKVRDAETALEKAKMFDTNGDPAGAWETVQIATLNWPEDSKLNQALGLYASKAPEFVGSLNKAATAEKDKRFGASVSLFALAKNRYPGSQLANEGLKRVSKEILDPEKEEPDKANDPAKPEAPTPSPLPKSKSDPGS